MAKVQMVQHADTWKSFVGNRKEEIWNSLTGVQALQAAKSHAEEAQSLEEQWYPWRSVSCRLLV